MPDSDIAKTSEAFRRLRGEQDRRWSELQEKDIGNAGLYWLERAESMGERTFLIQAETGRKLSYAEYASAVRNVAARLRELGSSRIALFNDSSLDFVCVLNAAGALGIEAVLLNVRESAAQLNGRLEQTENPPLIGGPPELEPISSLRDFASSASRQNQTTPTRTTVLDDTFCFIFTSGTSGRPKAARFSHRRMIDAGIDWSGHTEMSSESTCYIPLPLYHGNGLAVALASVIESGAKAVLRDLFSVSHFWSDIEDYDCTHSVYIGETWDYLRSAKRYADFQPRTPLVTFGNGLKSDTWQELLERQWVAKVVEHYGATELPAEALINSYQKVGRCGYLPTDESESKDAVLLLSEGSLGGPGTEGELLLRVRSGQYDGFLESARSEDRLIRDLMCPGDLWWKSGDILRWEKNGFFTFIRRKGENLRVKGENLSHEELRNAAKQTPAVREAYFTVVESHADSEREELVALVQPRAGEIFDEEELIDSMQEHLPTYAVPTRVETMKKLPTTSTHKVPAQSRLKEVVDHVATSS